jgi:hypothetical protein
MGNSKPSQKMTASADLLVPQVSQFNMVRVSQKSRQNLVGQA